MSIERRSPIGCVYRLINGGLWGWGVGLWVPDWLLLLLFTIAPIARFIAHRRDLARIGLCESCGYDLRASAGSCPECGAPIAANSAADSLQP
ncbi:MAG: hypothetical protein NTW19_05285 [Planctomycetota bacterium]|nr:hypothetical protein [Planctomycetota bacterium]